MAHGTTVTTALRGTAASPARGRQPWLWLTGHRATAFLAVGGTAYVVDVAAFNVLLSSPPLAGRDPSLARALAVVLAMVVTYLGNRHVTWRDRDQPRPVRQITLFVTANLLGAAFSTACLAISHDLLGYTSRLADNLSANVVGLALATAFRYWAYQRYVFARRRV